MSGVVESLRRINASPPPEESIALRAAVLVSVMAGVLSVLSEEVGTPTLRIASLAGIPFGFAYSHRFRNRPNFWLKVGLAGGLLLSFGQFLASISRIDNYSVADVQIPLAELFLWVQVLHSMDVPARRDLLFSLASSLTLVAVGGVLSISIDFGLNLAVWGVAALVSLVLIHRSELGDLRPLAVDVPAARGVRVGVSMAKVTAALVAMIAVIATAVFVVAPPAGTARALVFPTRLPRALGIPNAGGISNPSLGDADPARRGQRGESRATFGYFGFSSELDTSVRGRPDRTLVMRVRAQEPDFWRGMTFDVWDGRVWRQSFTDEDADPISGISPLDIGRRLGDDGAAGEEFVQTFYIEGIGPNLVFHAYRPQQLYFPVAGVFQMPDGTLRAGVDLEEGAVYTVISSRRAVTEERLRTADNRRPNPEVVARYAQPPLITDRVRELAADVTRDAPTTYDKIRALEAWMGEHTRYSLDVPPLPAGADAVDQFLFVDRIGFCEQIASSLVVMLRSLGIPARVAVGYTPGERNPFTGMFEVRAEDAHSWAEVYFPGLGWQGFDPTASVPFSGEVDAGTAGQGLFTYLGRNLPRPPLWVFQTVGALLGAGILLVVVAMFTGLWKGRRRRAARPWVEVMVERLEHEGAARGRPRRTSETVREYASVLRRSVVPDHRISEVAGVLDTELFSGTAASVDDRRRAEHALHDIGSGTSRP